MPKKIEVGYLCSRGHFVLEGDPEDSCQSKRVGTVYVKREAGAYKSLFKESLQDALVSYQQKLYAWRNG